MFTDWTEALEAEALPLNPNPQQQQAAAARTAARHASSKEDLVLLLDAIGLPGDDDTLTTLLPLIPDHAGEPGMNERPLNATEATALSMYYDGANTAAITDATGLTEDEILALAETNDPPRSTATDDAAETDSAEADSAEADRTEADGVEQLLAWAEGHPTASIRIKAAHVRGDLAELTARRATDDAQREAEERVTHLKAELEKAQADLRAVKAGTAPTATVAPTPIRSGLGSGRSREQLAAIRTWARANGHPVADAGMIRKSVLDAYDAAHQAPTATAS